MRSILASSFLSVVLLGCADDAAPWPPDHWPGEDLAACTLERRAYRIDEVRTPTTDEDADRLGWDLDHDGRIDNQGGFVLQAVAGYFDADLAAEANETLAADLTHIALSVDQCSEQNYALVELHRGLEIDRTLEPPRLIAEAVTTYAMVAPEVPGPAEFGWSQFPVGTLVHPGEATWIDAPRFTVVIDTIDDGELRGRIVGAFDGEQVADAVARAMVREIADRVAANPECRDEETCGDDPALLTLMGLLDENGDWNVTVEEIRTNGLVSALLNPDVEGDGPVWDSTTEEQRLYAVGVGFTASRVELFVSDATPRSE